MEVMRAWRRRIMDVVQARLCRLLQTYRRCLLPLASCVLSLEYLRAVLVCVLPGSYTSMR